MKEKRIIPMKKSQKKSGRYILLMAEKIGTRYNFNSYTFKDEMVADGILRAIEVFDHFDIDRPGASPFSYFSKVIFRSFVQRIKKEKAELAKRDLLIMVDEIYSLQDDDDCKISKDQIIGDFQFNSGDWT